MRARGDGTGLVGTTAVLATFGGRELRTIIAVPDISCAGCAASIKRALSRLDGVESVDVDVEQKLVDVQYNNSTNEDSVKAKIRAAGYSVNE
jgi:copper chaperone CopZ